MLFIMTQQVQPAFCMAVMQSQHAWIMAQHSLSPLVQVMQTPDSVGSQRHMPIIRLQQQAIMPFIIMQQLHMPAASMVHRFWSMAAAVASSHLQWIFIPPVHFSKVIAHWGTMTMFIPAAPVVGVPIMPGVAPIPRPGMAIPDRSITIADFMDPSPVVESSGAGRPSARPVAYSRASDL
jgi:hypothetical protein